MHLLSIDNPTISTPSLLPPAIHFMDYLIIRTGSHISNAGLISLGMFDYPPAATKIYPTNLLDTFLW